MTDETAISARVGEILADILGLPPARVGPGLSTSTSASWTSLNHLMLISQLESEFGVVFSNEEIRELTSFSAIVETLGRRLASSA
jgi:acyl carrier protein